MRRLVNFKVKRISEGRYRCISDDFSDLTVEGSTEWEAVTAARKMASQLVGTDDDRRR